MLWRSNLFKTCRTSYLFLLGYVEHIFHKPPNNMIITVMSPEHLYFYVSAFCLCCHSYTKLFLRDTKSAHRKFKNVFQTGWMKTIQILVFRKCLQLSKLSQTQNTVVPLIKPMVKWALLLIKRKIVWSRITPFISVIKKTLCKPTTRLISPVFEHICLNLGEKTSQLTLLCFTFDGFTLSYAADLVLNSISFVTDHLTVW